MIYSRALRNMEVQRGRHDKLFIFSKGCCLTYSMIRILKRPHIESDQRKFSHARSLNPLESQAHHFSRFGRFIRSHRIMGFEVFQLGRVSWVVPHLRCYLLVASLRSGIMGQEEEDHATLRLAVPLHDDCRRSDCAGSLLLQQKLMVTLR
jgi:hypothetical protein